MVLAKVNDHDQAKLFFEEFNIPYEVITRGENKGRLRVKPVRSVDGRNLLEAKRKLEAASLGYIVDHMNCFRDEEDRTVCTFSPYTADAVPYGTDWLEMSDYSIYGMWTKTFVIVVE